MQLIVRSVIAACIVSLLFVVLNAWFWGTSVQFKEGLDPQEFNLLSYEEQQIWLKENQVVVSGLDYLRQLIDFPSLWWEQGLVRTFGLSFLLTYVVCWYVFRGVVIDT